MPVTVALLARHKRQPVGVGRKALFDHQGRRLMRGLEHLAEAERARKQLGSLAVPYGTCVEPANIASMAPRRVVAGDDLRRWQRPVLA